MDTVFDLLFKNMKPPKMNLSTPSFSLPHPMFIFFLVLWSYFLVMSGIIYDIINQPPSMGQERVGNVVKPVAIMAYRLNGQYIIEGFSAGMIFVIGAGALIMLDVASKSQWTSKAKYITMLVSIFVIAGAYNLAIVFLRLKVPGYLR